MNEIDFLRKTIELSQKSVEEGGYPVGSVVVRNGEIISTGLSNGKQLHDPTSHAETAAIREASMKLKMRDLVDVTLYSSLEPCLMCYTSSFWAHIPKIIYACSRDQVTNEYYEGEHNLSKLNDKAHRHIELVHVKELEIDALKIIQNWEGAKKL